MHKLLQSRIEVYKKLIEASLDSDDANGALKYRAIQKELEFIYSNLYGIKCNVNESHEKYYTTQEVANLLKISPSAVTRKSILLKATKIKGKWIYPKVVADAYLVDFAYQSKRGRKPHQLEI